MAQKQGQWWLPLALFLALAFAVGGVLLASNLGGRQPIEIILSTPTPVPTKQIYIGGAVTNPGLYPASGDDRLDDLLLAAGGVTSQAERNRLNLIVPRAGESSSPQKININTAEPWLLEALPGIGQRLARAVVDYRTQNGPFRHIQDITKVPGISHSLYVRIENLITVGE